MSIPRFTFKRLLLTVFFTPVITSNSTSSEKNEFVCDNGKRIPLSWRCDGDLDCVNAEDESNCSFECGANQFKCMSFPWRPEFKPTNNSCLPIELKCNGEVDCADFSDELNCGDIQCSDNEFHCELYNNPGEKCIPDSWRCDTRDDCLFSDDELLCGARTCRDAQFLCQSGRCISQKWVCDGANDCEQGEDEINCAPRKIRNCEEKNMFKCANSTDCIRKDWLCDGEYDCDDHSDETKCEYESHQCKRPSIEFACESGNTCIDRKWLCDGDMDCLDGSDESKKYCLNKVNSCPQELRCANGTCISEAMKCDGNRDCLDDSDEINCSYTNKSNCDHEKQFECPESHKCIDYSYLCNAIIDNLVMMLEIEKCSELATECRTNHYKCHKGSEGCKCHDSYIKGSEICYCKNGWKLMKNENDNNTIGTCVDIDECEIPGSCDQICTNTKGSYKCDCITGYKLTHSFSSTVPNSCRAVGSDTLLFVSDKASIRQYNKANNTFLPFIDNPGYVVSMDFLFTERKLFWCDSSQKKIMMSELDNEITIPLVSGENPSSLAIDWTHNLLFWTDSNLSQINVINLTTHKKKTLFEDHLFEPRDIAVDPELGVIFWIDSGETATIQRAGMDGSNRQIIVDGERIKHPRGIGLDYIKKRVYFADIKLKGLFSCDYWGQNMNTVLKNHDSIGHPFSIDVFEDNVYYTDFQFNRVNSVNKFHGGNRFKHVKTVAKPTVVKILHLQSQPRFENKCYNSDCGSSLCLPRPVYIQASKSLERSWRGKPFVCAREDEDSDFSLFLLFVAMSAILLIALVFFLVVLHLRSGDIAMCLFSFQK